MSPKYGNNIFLTLTSASYTMSVDNFDYGLFLTRAPIETSKPFSKHATTTSSYLSSTTRNASIYALYTSSA